MNRLIYARGNRLGHAILAFAVAMFISAAWANEKTRPWAEAAANHAFKDHAGEFNVTSVKTFADRIEYALDNCTDSKNMQNGGWACWYDPYSMIVILNTTDSSKSTAFKPTGGKSYYDKQ